MPLLQSQNVENNERVRQMVFELRGDLERVQRLALRRENGTKKKHSYLSKD